MTLLYDNQEPGPKTHAFVFGVGNFPHLKGQSNKLFDGLRDVKDVTSPPNNAHALIDWLAKAADRLVPELGSIEALISETDRTPSIIPKDTYPHDPRVDGAIEPATGENVEKALSRWIDRCEADEENLALFYGSSHGMQAQEHILLLQDAGKRPKHPWENMVSLDHIHRNLYGNVNRRSLVLADCCRDLLKEGGDSVDQFTGRRIGNMTKNELVKASADPNRIVCVLRASPLGVLAVAEKDALGYFTESLLLCLNGAAGKHRTGFGWCVSPENLRSAIENAGRFGLDLVDIHLRPTEEDSHWTGPPIVKLQGGRPKFPVRVREEAVVDLGRAKLEIRNNANGFAAQRDPDIIARKSLCAWVKPDMDPYEATGEIPGAEGQPALALRPEEVLVFTEGLDVPLRRA